MGVVEHRPLPPSGYPALAELGLIGDGHSAALVSADGAVEWWCPARFDAPSVFASLLDRTRGGRFQLGIPVRHRRKGRYLDGTNILEMEWTTSDATLRLTAWMPHRESDASADGRRRIAMLLDGEGKEIDVSVDFAPAFDYARARHSLAEEDDALLATSRGAGGALRLTTTAPRPPAASAWTFRVSGGERHAFLLDHAATPPPAIRDPLAEAVESLERERAFWTRWGSRCTYEGAHGDEVRRSLLALKLLQHSPTGSFVAAPTCSLPERVGGGRNWDYRYSWLRDGSFIVMAFETMGYIDESRRFRRWLAGIVRRDGPEKLQMLYHVDGDRELHEETLDHLEGYRGSGPVRVGNAAAEQHQLDTYGEVMMCFHRADELFREEGPELWKAVRSFVDAVAARWREPDSGIWEMRGKHRGYVYSKALAWLALDHGLDIARRSAFEAPARGEWIRARDEIRADVEARGCVSGFGWVQSYGRRDADASNLLLPIFGFASFDDEATRETVATTRRALVARDLVHRYNVDDGLDGREGTFLAASFWLAHNLAVLGEREEAEQVFAQASRVAGPLGLLPEEANDVSGEGVGNFPQAFSHLALLLAADALERPGGWRQRHVEADGALTR